MTQNKFMAMAIEEAKKGLKIGEIPIGCVITNKEDKVLARSHNSVVSRKDPVGHAELNAIREACEIINSDRLVDCNIYVTLEPCIMCASAISKAKLKRLYYGADDLKYGSINGNLNFFISKNCNHLPEIYDNISKTDCENLINNFFKGKR